MTDLTSKQCARCKIEKPIGDFYKGKGLGGKHSWCKACVKTNSADWWKDHQAQHRTAQRQRQAAFRALKVNHEKEYQFILSGIVRRESKEQ